MTNARLYHLRMAMGKHRLAGLIVACVVLSGFSSLAMGVPEPVGMAAGAKPRVMNRVVEPARRTFGVGKRDPFYIPPPPVPNRSGLPTGPLPPGIRGLIIGQLRLEGIVRENETGRMIAVVTNYTNRAYFLKVSDQLYDGSVEKITPHAVYFKQNHLEANGRLTTVEVVKSLGPAAGATR